MLVLALDTATARITAGVVELPDAGGSSGSSSPIGVLPSMLRLPPPRTLAARDGEGARAHAELLAPAIADALAGAGRTRADLDAVVAGVGPGPFTGLRVGLVTAAAMGDALGIPVHGVPTHDALAVGAAGSVLVVTDARRREVYWSLLADGVRTHGPEVVRPDELAARIGPEGDLGRVDVVLGDAAEKVGGAPGAPGPTPAGLVAVAAPALRAGDVPGPLVPLYLRRPDAVPPGAPKAVTRAAP
ncbi:tRNA (adenosine(37)-N6)-threonylcarbamoyltransferase complex dimerization subunit type 1 TsaB [Actinomycetospora sp. NBRC 106375]|uniref:tRNA (adenosine(37)-N6)-threonylcarbamoyltransferase complex dimerization subunit type 1 TsaB n=1 Tax=Actinomycetospora sp. NBRC 106375 TaxID=3032207 RepID=UPI0024A25F6F|nr:tRNA (adenosine(37)-N6)-threonylcarbamoyltransferase complex dimerization subunit type 1 TsaB [Actinomycetospora sp. NBRC 106375]GLZ44592.1 tRNA (adenosine(37)-N6)-threonylcarbamoyltransferase complex dimerization subunit type 1 TsaB [Actinomycetospora sp. NBRC 106375]